ncbi:unnamed protein product [Notodromas monacha]|uniref:BTB domain-containing protein n=1 Tax=Notodromas monacha TaxID=399045 RepID=A0A7R9BLV4_9CRUS|nr:unnamed protein product [Notodromas monacha]CAG0916528.1 unnamed protein product [Notodromas monacha]
MSPGKKPWQPDGAACCTSFILPPSPYIMGVPTLSARMDARVQYAMLVLYTDTVSVTVYVRLARSEEVANARDGERERDVCAHGRRGRDEGIRAKLLLGASSLAAVRMGMGVWIVAVSAAGASSFFFPSSVVYRSCFRQGNGVNNTARIRSVVVTPSGMGSNVAALGKAPESSALQERLEVLYCGDKQFRAHKVILAACCTFFEKVVNDLDPRASAALIVTDAAPDLLELVLDFVYNGEVFLDATQLDPFMALAAKLEVRGLKMMEKVGDLFVKQDATPGATSATTTTTSTATATAAATPGGNNRKRVVAVDSNANERNNKKPKADCNGKTAGFDASNGRLVSSSASVKDGANVNAKAIFKRLVSSSASVKDGANVNAKAIFKRFLPGVTIEPSATSLRSDLIVAKRVPGHKMIPAMEDTRTSSVGSDDIEGDIVELDQELPLVKAEYAEEEDEEDYVEDEDFLPGDMMKDETLSDFHDGGEDQEQPSNIPPEICIATKESIAILVVIRGVLEREVELIKKRGWQVLLCVPRIFLDIAG